MKIVDATLNNIITTFIPIKRRIKVILEKIYQPINENNSTGTYNKKTTDFKNQISTKKRGG